MQGSSRALTTSLWIVRGCIVSLTKGRPALLTGLSWRYSETDYRLIFATALIILFWFLPLDSPCFRRCYLCVLNAMLAPLYGRLDTLCDCIVCGLFWWSQVGCSNFSHFRFQVTFPSVYSHFALSSWTLSWLDLDGLCLDFQFGGLVSTSNGLRRGFSSMILSSVHLGPCTHPLAEKFGKGVHRAFLEYSPGHYQVPTSTKVLWVISRRSAAITHGMRWLRERHSRKSR
jgi:hypothetical protein